jgi:hypothetical protein
MFLDRVLAFSSPARRQAKLAEKIRESEKSRSFDQTVKKVGRAKAFLPVIRADQTAEMNAHKILPARV